MTAGQVRTENAMFILFCSESEKIVIMSGQERSIYPLFILSFFCLNSKCQLILGSIHPAVY